MASRSYGNTIFCESHPDAPLIEEFHIGDMICSECGLVVADRAIAVDSGKRTHTGDNGEDVSENGPIEDTSMGGTDLGTTIGHSTGPAGFDTNGTPLYRNKNNENAAVKAKLKANRAIKEFAERLNADQSIIHASRQIFQNVYHNKLLKGRSNNSIIAACIFMACRQLSVPRTFKEISDVAVGLTSIKEIAKCYQIIRNLIGPELDSKTFFSLDPIDRFCSKLNLPRQIKKLAEQIIKKINDIPSLISRSPNSLAAAAISMACELTENSSLRTAEEIGRICGAAENTIKQTIKAMQPFKNVLIPADLKPYLTSDH